MLFLLMVPWLQLHNATVTWWTTLKLPGLVVDGFFVWVLKCLDVGVKTLCLWYATRLETVAVGCLGVFACLPTRDCSVDGGDYLASLFNVWLASHFFATLVLTFFPALRSGLLGSLTCRASFFSGFRGSFLCW